MATVDTPHGVSGVSERGIVLEGVSWDTYEKLNRGLGDRRIFVTYDRGLMEIEMSPSRIHESGNDLLVALIHAIRLLKKIPMEAGGSTTHKRVDLENAVEPDACYWIANEKVMRGVQQLDLAMHPAPDLVIEIDITSSSIDRIEVFRRLGAPEVWRAHRDGLQFLVLDSEGAYSDQETSKSFPFVQRAVVEKAMRLRGVEGETAALEWLLKELGVQ